MLQRVLNTVFICLSVAACTGQSQIESDIDKLSERLSSFTGISAQKSEIQPVLSAPAKHTLAISIDELQIGIREFYAIDDCPLGQFIAQRNTSLGKTHLPSTRFIYEKELMSTLRICMNQLDEGHRMQNPLASWIAHKQHNLSSVWANMMTQSDEVYLAFTMTGDFITGDSNDSLTGSRLALGQLIESLDSTEIDSNALELHLRELSESRLPAKMWKTQALLTQELPLISALLQEYITTSEQACNRAKREELKIMRNIFSVLFADTIQALASQLNHYQYQLNPYFESLANHPSIPPAWQGYINQQYITQAKEYKRNMQSHIELWQQVFKLCE